jgi:hypothetical protein
LRHLTVLAERTEDGAGERADPGEKSEEHDRTLTRHWLNPHIIKTIFEMVISATEIRGAH